MTTIFTVEQANKTLPLVRRIVDDLVRYHARWQEMVAACDSLVLTNSDQAQAQIAALQGEIQRTAGEIDRFLSELRELGVQFKGFEQGLVDFPARLHDRDVLLCWKAGESSVAYWHELDAGYAGRLLLNAEEKE